MTEKWREVLGYEGLYKVSNLGRIKSRNKLKVQQDNGRGYLVVHLNKNGKPKWHLVHRLVAQAFIDNPQNKPTVNHKDGDRTNNKAINLEWATYSENNSHSYRSNGRKSAVAKPIYLVETGEIYSSSYEASRKTGISQSSINRCANGKLNAVKGTHWKLLNKRKEIKNV